MKLSKREQSILMIVPAVLTAAIYNWYFSRPATKALKDAQTELAKLEQSMPTDKDLSAKQSLLTTMNRELATEKQTSERLHSNSARFTAAFGTPTAQARALEVLAETFASRQISLMKSAHRNEGAPKDIEAFCKKRELPTPQLWRVEAVGSYDNMQRALNALSYSRECLLPISVEMENTGQQREEQALQRWTLTFWM